MKIIYRDGLGFDSESGTFKAHFRVGGKTYSRDTGCKLERDAKAWLRQQKASLRPGHQSTVIRGLTLIEGVEIWAREAPVDKRRRRNPGPRTVKCVRQVFRSHFTQEELGTPIERLPEGFLLDAARRYEFTDGPRGPHKKSGVRNFIISINTPFRYLLGAKLVAEIPTLPVVPAVSQTPIHFIPPAKLLDVLEDFDRRVGYDLFAMAYIRFLAFTGLRTEDARAMRKEKILFQEQCFYTGQTKNGEEYLFPLPDDLVDLLKRLPDIHNPGQLFQASQGTCAFRSYAWCLRSFKESCRALGVTTSMAWHTLRASYATFLVRSGVDLLVIKELMGHKTLTMVLRYAATLQEDKRQGQVRGLNYLRWLKEQQSDTAPVRRASGPERSSLPWAHGYPNR